MASVLFGKTPCKDGLAQGSAEEKRLVEPDLERVLERETLDKLALLYAYVLKMNLCINVSAELYLLVELLTVQETEEKAAEKKTSEEGSSR